MADLGFEIVRVRFGGRPGSHLQIMIEHADRATLIEDCEKVANSLSVIFDIEGPVDPSYVLEISSPGIDRPLTRLADFASWQGHDAALTTCKPVEGRRKFKGRLAGTDGNKITLENDRETFTFEFSDLAAARLLLTDALLEKTEAERMK